MKVKNMKPGDRAVITGYREGSRGYRMNLLAMGLTRGAGIKLIRVAPMGDPIELEVRGYRLSLRKNEADILEIEGESR